MWRQLQVYAAKRSETGMDPVIKILPRQLMVFGKRQLQDASGFRLHGVSTLRSTNAQPFLSFNALSKLRMVSVAIDCRHADFSIPSPLFGFELLFHNNQQPGKA
jgi:hypothetical protein